MIILPVIPLSARFRARAKRESARFLERVQGMTQHDLRPRLLHGHRDTVGAAIRIGYDRTGAFRDLDVGIAPASASAWNAAVTPIRIRRDLGLEIRRLRADIYLLHAGTLFRRFVGDRPFLIETDAELAMTCQDAIPPYALHAACGQEGDEDLIRVEFAARHAQAEIETRRGESNHARLARLAASRAADAR